MKGTENIKSSEKVKGTFRHFSDNAPHFKLTFFVGNCFWGCLVVNNVFKP